MLGRSLHFDTPESPEVVLDRLATVVLPSEVIAPLMFAVFVAGALALSFFGPLGAHAIQVVLSLALALPFVVVTRSFRREATVAENVLRQALSGN